MYHIYPHATLPGCTSTNKVVVLVLITETYQYLQEDALSHYFVE